MITHICSLDCSRSSWYLTLASVKRFNASLASFSAASSPAVFACKPTLVQSQLRAQVVLDDARLPQVLALAFQIRVFRAQRLVRGPFHFVNFL